MNLMRFFLGSILLFCFLRPFSQTLIIAVRQGEELYVGADTRIRGFENDSIKRFDTVKKIIPFGQFYLAFSGYINMSLPYLAKQIQIKSSLYSTIVDFSILWRNYLEQELNNIRLSDSLKYKNNFANINSGAILFFGFEDNQIVNYALYSSCISRINEPTKFQIKIDSLIRDDPNRMYILMHGHSNAVESIGFDYIKKYGFIEGVQMLICKQSEATPNFVSSPIDIIHLKSNKYTCKYP